MSDAPLPFEGLRILFVGGKGGVGKTTVAAALAVRRAEAGERVLLVSTDPAHSLGDLFGRTIGDRETEILPGLRALEIDPEREVDRYLGEVKRNMREFVRPAMYHEIDRQIELTRRSPGAEEAALLDRVSRILAELPEGTDRLIFDTAPTGHTLRLLALPELMAAWTEGLLRSRERSDALGKALDRLKGRREPRREPEGGGEEAAGAGEAEGGGDDLSWFETPGEEPRDERGRRIRDVLMERRRRFGRARRTLLDPETTGFLFVLTPEKLPILETRRALEVLRGHDVPVVGLVVNRVLPEEPLGDFLEDRREQEAAYMARIEEDFAGLPRIRIPLLPRDVEGVEELRRVGEHLA